ncbi:MAG: hypothetical protein ACKVQC_09215 [Elusimicrobiota bacterium]
MPFKKLLILISFLVTASGAVLAGDVDLKLTTNNGTTKLSVLDSASVEVASVTSDGDAYFNSITVTNAGNLILNTATLQANSTFYVSSGTVAGQLSVTTLKFVDGSSMTTVASLPSRSFVGHWGVANLAGTVADSQMVFDVAGAAQIAAGSRMKMPYAGTARGICVSGSAARSAGTATFQIFKNAVDIGATSDAVIDGTNTQFVCSTAGTGTFVAGDILDVRVTSSALTPAASTEYTADIIVEWSN